jgi:ATP synthase F1 complex assembly factor 1
MQLQNHQVAFTPLIEYQAHRDNAPAVLVMNHYTELSDSKGIVLMQGEFDSKRISPEIASQLAHSMQRYYITDQEKLEIVRGFNLDPANFSIASIVDVVK